jgi:FlaG/FlaF family flagellin (archaellin)
MWSGEMKNTTFSKDYSAASEVIGAILLVLIALGAFGAIYFQIFPVQLPSAEPHTLIKGYVTDDGRVVLEHIGGEQLISYRVTVEQSDGPHVYTYENAPWAIGGCYYPPLNITLFDQEKQVKISVYEMLEDGSTHCVFDGIITPKDHPPGPSLQLLPDPMLISTLRSNSSDEDLICYSYSIIPNIQPKTFIYDWMVATTGLYQPLTRLLMPFDTQNPFTTKDYSGNHNNGTITGATWTAAGKLGGAYQFNGSHFITIPYCFQNNKIDKITVEVWVKTNGNSGTILSYNRSNYWELAVSDGHVKWSTNASDGTVDVKGTAIVNDNTWHLVAVTYNSSLGDCAIYVDGSLDVYQHVHGAGKLLGSGNSPPGAIGKGVGVTSTQTIFSTGFETQAEKNQWREQNSTGSQETWVNLRYDNFNINWGSYTDGGVDCYQTSTYKHEGSQSACIRDNSGDDSSFYLTNGIDVDTPAYKSIKIDFWWMWNGNGWSTGEDWWLLYFNGVSWINVVDVIYPSGYVKDKWYHSVVYINESNYLFPKNMKIRFQCDASYNDDLVYIDQVYINATTYGRIEGFFDLLPSTALIPHTGIYSIGGTGDFDPEYAMYNRTGIDISGYSNVQLSVWYSYKNTESSDFLGLYYLNGSHWQPIFEKNNPQAAGQAPWTKVTVNISSTITNLRLQFKWRTSSTTEYVALDDLEITGLPHGGEKNYTGVLDEVKIYSRDLSPEQLYQNYLCTRNGNSNISVFVSEEICVDESWKCIVTPNNGMQDDLPTESNIINIINYGGG